MAQHNHDAAKLQAMIEQLQAENAKLKATVKVKKDTTDLGDGLSAAVSEKGGVSVYGLGRFPVTVYGEQWIRLAKALPAILAFIAANQDKLSTKADRDKRKAAEKSAAKAS